jgi:voltage-gated potassium channel
MEDNSTRYELKSTNYEFFILALSILSLVNWVFVLVIRDVQIERIVVVIDLLLSFVFLVDFIYRLSTAENKREYFVRQSGWLDLLSSLPFPQVKILRLVRVIRSIRLLRMFGLRKTLDEFLLTRAGSAVYLVSFLIILVLEFGSMAILFAEQDAPGSTINTTSDAIWWVLVTISTVGYGDEYPVTQQGRLIATVVIVTGVALFGVVTGFLANAFESDGSSNAIQNRVISRLAADDSTSILDEIASLRQAQAEANAEFNGHLARLVEKLEQAQEAAGDG